MKQIDTFRMWDFLLRPDFFHRKNGVKEEGSGKGPRKEGLFQTTRDLRNTTECSMCGVYLDLDVNSVASHS